MPDNSERQPDHLNHANAPDTLASAILARVGLQRMVAFTGEQEYEAVAGLSNPAWPVRAAAVQALAERGERAPIAPLVGALRDEHESVRAAAARALGTLSNRTPVEPLVAALGDSRWPVRTAAVLALGRLKQRTPVEPLVAALKDQDESVRAAAASALGGLGERTPIGPLVGALRDSAWPVREAAALALKEVGQRAPVAPLLATHLDQDSQVREAAEWALGAPFSGRPGLYGERSFPMSQRVDFDEQPGYQASHEYDSGLYQGPGPLPGNHPGMVGLAFSPSHASEPNSSRNRLIVAICSLAMLVVTVIGLVSIHYDNGYTLLAALIALGLICGTIAIINIAFNAGH